MSSALRILTVCATLLLGACSSLNPFSSGDGKVPALKPLADPIKVVEGWRVKVGSAGMFSFQPAVSGAAVFAAAADGTVLRIEDGRTIWKTTLNVRLSGGVGMGAGLVLVASPKGEVIALDALTGQERWRAAVNAEVLAAPAVGDSVVVVRSADSRLFGLDLAGGKQRWVYQRVNPPLVLRNPAGVVLDNNVIYAGFPGGKLAAVSATNGNLLWEGTVAVPRGATELERIADISSVPVLSPRLACAVAYQGRVACFDPANGSTLWTRDISSAKGLDFDGKAVYVSDAKGALHALDVGSGASLWKQDALAGRLPGRPRVMDDYLVVGDVEGVVHALRKDDGSLVGRVRTDSSAILADPQRSAGDVIVQTRDGSVYALDFK